MIHTCVQAGPQGGEKWATVCSGRGGSMFPVLMDVGVTRFWVCWVLLHNGFEDSGLSLEIPHYMALAGGLEILQRWYFQTYREHLALSAFIKSFPLVFLASLMCHIYSTQLSAGDPLLLPGRKGLGTPLSPGIFCCCSHAHCAAPKYHPCESALPRCCMQ